MHDANGRIKEKYKYLFEDPNPRNKKEERKLKRKLRNDTTYNLSSDSQYPFDVDSKQSIRKKILYKIRQKEMEKQQWKEFKWRLKHANVITKRM